MPPKDNDSVEIELRKLETNLLQPEVRRNREMLSSLMADEFIEYGSSGRVYTKQEEIDGLPTESPARFSIRHFSVTILAVGAALVRYQAARHDESGGGITKSLRSSLWVLRDNRWQMLFHQGTKLAKNQAGSEEGR